VLVALVEQVVVEWLTEVTLYLAPSLQMAVAMVQAEAPVIPVLQQADLVVVDISL
jgi:hypothetical protein